VPVLTPVDGFHADACFLPLQDKERIVAVEVFTPR
jgi:hypothetical protein